MKFDQPGLEATLLKPTNECGVEKLVCTFVKVMMMTTMMMIIFIMFLKPTVLPYSHLFDVDACAKFVSDFVYYNPDRWEAIVLGKLYWYSHFPSIEIELEILCRAFKGSLNSPSRVLQEQIGNSFEMSVLLVSLLRWASL